MANRWRNQTTGYRSYGSVAYAPEFDGSAVRVPEYQEIPLPNPRVGERTRERAVTRTRVEVREVGQVAPFGIIGFLAVGVFAALLLFSYAQYTVMADQMVMLRRELSTAQAESAALSAQYERVFDVDTIQMAVGETMVLPSADQIVYIDLSEEDNVMLYQGESRTGGIAGLFAGAKEIVTEVVEYLR